MHCPTFKSCSSFTSFCVLPEEKCRKIIHFHRGPPQTPPHTKQLTQQHCETRLDIINNNGNKTLSATKHKPINITHAHKTRLLASAKQTSISTYQHTPGQRQRSCYTLRKRGKNIIPTTHPHVSASRIQPATRHLALKPSIIYSSSPIPPFPSSCQPRPFLPVSSAW